VSRLRRFNVLALCISAFLYLNSITVIPRITKNIANAMNPMDIQVITRSKSLSPHPPLFPLFPPPRRSANDVKCSKLNC